MNEKQKIATTARKPRFLWVLLVAIVGYLILYFLDIHVTTQMTPQEKELYLKKKQLEESLLDQ